MALARGDLLQVLNLRNTYKWWLVAMLWLVCLLNYADRQAIFSVFPLLKSELHLSDLQLGIVGSSFMWVYALSGPIAGLSGDRFSRKLLIIIGLIFWSLITLATALSRSYGQLVLFRALQGLGEAFYFPASMSLLSAYHDPRTRSRAMSIHQSSVYAGTIVGGTVSGFMAEHYGWRSSCCLFGAVGVLWGLALLGLLREPARGPEPVSAGVPQSGTVGSVREAFAHPMAIVLMLVFVGANFVAMIFLTWLPAFLYRKFGMSLSMAGLNATVYLQTASMIGVLSGGVLADRLVRRTPAGRMVVQAIGLALGVPFLFLSGWTISVGVLVLALTGFGYCKGLYDANIWASLHDVVPMEKRATSVGVMNSIGWIGGGMAPLAIAAAAQTYSMSVCLSATSLLYFLVAVMLLLSIWILYGRSNAPKIAGPSQGRILSGS